MGRSCVYYSENIDTYHVAMDNLVVAKRLFDLGKKLPENYVFTMDRVSDRHDSFFLQGLEILTGSEADILEDYGDDYTFHMDLPEVTRWIEIERIHPEAAADREWIWEPISEENLDCEYTDVHVEMEMSETGLAFHVMGVGSYYLIFERICDCYFRLKEKITEWGAREENHVRVNSKRNNHSDARERKGQHQVSTCPAAG
ncbi:MULTISPECIES: hypothetical protein [unclassified Paenibacillus]|uniref:Uncharacterized protein n=1 Tax=Paenibacillus provencensis TaxID=441151 RepID=A0ABW3Q2C4_9BACL|nr:MULTISPECIES: hypothetical protein [unclassified Paenibacillus]MCM3130171.1 hypothetical protein [Paenibacillus sp. MER 78]SDX71027.1 hypothetical protein SAMN05518848_11263 [Paenibacillus sp. PDC88]SFS88438.1 hypothetical protein SAMN04488601_10659 [Paenibacillus sp. 453mf]